MLKTHDLTILKNLDEELVRINIEVKKGEVVGLVGPNSSGKSLLLSALALQEETFSGDVIVNHYHAKNEPVKAKQHIGYLPGTFTPTPFLTGYEYLETVGAFYNLSPKIRTERILSLAERLDCKSYLYTLNERSGSAFHQRLGIMASLIHSPDVLIWDEPFQFLDEAARQATLELLDDHIKRGGCALVASNELAMIENISDQVIVINEGQVLAEGSLAHLYNHFRPDRKDLSALYRKVFS